MKLGVPTTEIIPFGEVVLNPEDITVSDDASVYYEGNINDDKMIGYTKAISEGFTAKRNDNLVARPPQRMKNNGYLNPR